MKLLPIALIIFWIIVISAPEILAYLIWWLFIFLWINWLILGWLFSKMKKWNKSDEAYVKFGDYKIYR